MFLENLVSTPRIYIQGDPKIIGNGLRYGGREGKHIVRPSAVSDASPELNIIVLMFDFTWRALFVCVVHAEFVPRVKQLIRSSTWKS